MARTVVTPDQGEWRVGRDWVPLRLRLPRRGARDRDFPSDAFDFDFLDDGGLLAGLAVLATVVLLFLVVWPVIAIAIEFVVLILVVLATLAGRVVLRRPWTVFAVARTGRTITWEVVGWRASGELIDEVAGALRQGRALPTAHMG